MATFTRRTVPHLVGILSIPTILIGCGSTTPTTPRSVSALVQLTCDFATVREFQLYWDGRLVANDSYQAITVNLTSLSYDGSVPPGAHTIGVAIASQTASPNRCYINGLVTAPTGGASNGPQLVVFSETRSLATGVVSAFIVNVK